MGVFDQRGQRVTQQYNAAGNITFDGISDTPTFIAELRRLRAELASIVERDGPESGNAAEAATSMDAVIHEATLPAPNKGKLLTYIDAARTVLAGVTGVTGLVGALTAAAQVAQKLF